MNAPKSSLTKKRRQMEKTLRLRETEVMPPTEKTDEAVGDLRLSGLTSGNEQAIIPMTGMTRSTPVQTPALENISDHLTAGE